jgi:hypothetical protein
MLNVSEEFRLAVLQGAAADGGMGDDEAHRLDEGKGIFILLYSRE